MTETRVSIRPVLPGDLPVFFEHHRDPVAVHMAAFVRGDPADRAAFDAHWNRILGLDTVVARTVLADTTVVGHVAKFEMDGQPEVTYWIDRAHWGRGIATRALGRLLEEIPTRPMHARAAADNPASIRVLEKCGFRRVGTARAMAEARGVEIEEAVMVLPGRTSA